MRKCKFDKRYYCDYHFMKKNTPCEKCPIFHSCGQLPLMRFSQEKYNTQLREKMEVKR